MSQQIQDKIIRCLRVYTHLSPSMLHTGIGPGIPSAVWRPALRELIEQGKVIETKNMVDNREYTVLCLPEPIALLRQV